MTSTRALGRRARNLLLDMHLKSGVGHLGGNLSCLDILLAIMMVKTNDDSLVLSKGHSAGALYVAGATLGHIDASELNTFHKDGTRLPGHPPVCGLEGLNEFGTGSLGHGLSLALGVAVEKKESGAEGLVFCLCSDGELQEGQVFEAVMLASSLKLNNLVCVIDWNGLQGFGKTSELFSKDAALSLFESMGWSTVKEDGHDIERLLKLFSTTGDGDKPVAIFCDTVKGKGIERFEGKIASHYLPIEDVDLGK